MDTTSRILKLKNGGHIMEHSVLNFTNSIHYIPLPVFVLKTNHHSERGPRTVIVQSKSMQGLQSQFEYAKVRLVRTFPILHFKDGGKRIRSHVNKGEGRERTVWSRKLNLCRVA